MKSVGVLSSFFAYVAVASSSSSSSSSSSTAVAAVADIGTFLWFSDVHIDDYYGTKNAEVHKTSAPCANASAPYYSAYGCGSSIGLLKSTIESASRVISEEDDIPQPDFIVYTGDSARHDTQKVKLDGFNSSEATIAYVVDIAMTTVLDRIRNRFPDVPVVEFPSIDLGNNDLLGDYQLNVTSYLPCLIAEDEDANNTISIPNAIQNKWLINVADRFQNLFVDDKEYAVFACGGYIYRRLREGLWLISLNTIVWTLSHKPEINATMDPFGQHAWLRVQLENAKDQGDKVYVTGHVPPILQSFVGNPGEPLWQDEHVVKFMETINSYKDVVAGTFFAHVHSNELRAMPDMPEDFPPMLISGSISPCYTTTPFYSFIFYDRQTEFPVDIVTYNLNLDDVQNETITSHDDVSSTFNPPWKRMFQNLTSFLGISSLTNRETLLLADRLASNVSGDNTSVTFENYFQTWYKGVPQVCDEYCRKQEACLITCGFSGSTWESCVNDGDSCSLSPAVSPTSNPSTSVGSSPWQNVGWHGSIIMLTLLLSFTIITL